MQTVNFNCPHCGNLMAVGTNLLGRNVRCPHCKQVVRAPAAPNEGAPAPPPPPSQPPAQPDTIPTPVPQFKLPEQTEHHESIFGERHEEDVFGSEPLKPAVPPPVAPPPPPAPPPYLQETVGITAEAPPPRSAPPPEYEPFPQDQPYQPPTRRNREPEPQGRTDETPIEDEDEAPRRYASRAPREEPAATGAFAWILLTYGALITIVAGFFAFQYFTGGPSKDRYDIIPDVYGQYEKANRRQVSLKGLPDPKGELPPELRVKLGGELTIGDLQVRPVAVERRHRLMRMVKRAVEGDLEREYGAEALVLTLHVKNLSNDTTFHPNDPAFNRAFDKAMPMPYTALEFRNEMHYGPLPWPPEAGTDDEFIVGFGLEKDAPSLAPGAEGDVFVAVAPRGSKLDVRNLGTLLTDSGWKNNVATTEPFLWRVQLRRGIVKAEVDGNPVEISATAVIGVAFTAADVK
jgi:hypothetical protein